MVDPVVDHNVEPIPNEDSVSRGCYHPTGMAPESIFQFRSDSNTGERAESVYWRKYAATIESIHALGCNRVVLYRERRAQKMQEPLDLEYVGAITATVGAIRDIKTGRGFSLEVNHLPENGVRSHTHICVLEPSDGGQVRLKPNDRLELAHMLCTNAFGVIDSHSCNS